MINPRMFGVTKITVVSHPSKLEKASEDLIKSEGEDVVDRMIMTIYVFDSKEKKEEFIKMQKPQILNPKLLGIKRITLITHPSKLEKASEDLVEIEGKDVIDRMIITIYVFESKTKKDNFMELQKQFQQLMKG